MVASGGARDTAVPEYSRSDHPVTSARCTSPAHVAYLAGCGVDSPPLREIITEAHAADSSLRSVQASARDPASHRCGADGHWPLAAVPQDAGLLVRLVSAGGW